MRKVEDCQWFNGKFTGEENEDKKQNRSKTLGTVQSTDYIGEWSKHLEGEVSTLNQYLSLNVLFTRQNTRTKQTSSHVRMGEGERGKEKVHWQ